MNWARGYAAKSFFPAAVGCFLGYQWSLQTNTLISPGLYATGGAAFALLAVRLTSLICAILHDLFEN